MISSSATLINACENGDCVQQPSSCTSVFPSNTTTTEVVGSPSNPTTTQASRIHQESRKRSRGSTKLVRVDGQFSLSTGNANPTRSRRTTPRRFIEDDMIPADRDISDPPLICGTSNVPLPPTGRRQGSRNRSCRNTDRGPGSDSAVVDAEAGISSESADKEPGSSDAKVSEDDLTSEERAISGTHLLHDLRGHPSVYARAGRNPKAKGLSFRGAWKKAVGLYRAANDQYKQLFAAAGFGEFLKIEPAELPQGYLIALTERWFAETNSLHLPCCEIGPTPVDWTMITGLRFGGEPIKLDPTYKKEKVQELLEERSIFRGRRNVLSGNKIRLSVIRPKEAEVRAVPANKQAKERMFRRLFLYIIGSCFFGNSHSSIHHELVEYLEDIDAVGRYDWGALTYAIFLGGMRRKVNRGRGSFTGFWQFLLFWAFEYLNISRPEHILEDTFPRAMRWKFPKNHGTLDNSELTATRCQLDYVDDESQVTWQPYLASEIYISGAINSSIAFAKRRVPLMTFDTWEYYLGERFQRQLGLPCLVPSDPPKDMHWKIEVNDKVDCISFGKSAETLVNNEGKDYASWFADVSIGKIVDVTRLIGGPDTGGKVIGHWMAKHRPGMILVPKSEVKEIGEALGTAVAKREKLREELSRVRRGSESEGKNSHQDL